MQAMRHAVPLLRAAAAANARRPLAVCVAKVPRCGGGAALARRSGGWRGFASEASGAPEEKAAPQEPEPTVSGDASSFTFEAETRQLLDIVANSLYTDKEVFVRELISNSSDALNKLRSAQVAGEADGALPLEIAISTQPDDGTITIADTGIGMTKEELIRNLGTIARSGSKQFVSEMDSADGASEDVASSIIGRFGVGFYSAFMVADELTVYTRSATDGEVGWCWKSDGTGSYTIAEAEGVPIGTKVVIHLKDKEKGNFGNKYNLERLIKKYSNFVGFPIAVDGDRANKIEALWAQPASQITQEQHNEFYRFIANAFDTPRYQFQFAADAPLSIQCLLYVPQMSAEKLGMGRVNGGVSVYSRKVMIKDKVEDILPDWLRFMKGVIDSEDIPLNISRENLQDSSLIERVGSVVTRWVLGQLAREAKRDPVKYNEFYQEFGVYIKEGACSDRANMEAISKLLRFESSKPPPPLPAKDDDEEDEKTEKGAATELTTVSLAQVNERIVEGQKNIFYLATPSRELATSSPYFEAFEAADVEVLYVYNDMDEFVCQTIGSFDGKTLLNIETQEASAALKSMKASKKDEDDDSKDEPDPNALLETEVEAVTEWMKGVLSGKASSVKAAETGRMKSSPAMITGHSPSSALRLQKMFDPGADQTLPPQMLEINTAHPIIKGLHAKHTTDPELAALLAEQLYDNSLVAAGLLEDSRSMLPRVNTLMERLAESE